MVAAKLTAKTSDNHNDEAAPQQAIMTESTHTFRGKWSEKGVPKKGWNCVDVDDLGEPSQVCEMCETQDIRYVHVMEHPDYPDLLNVGCVCAERMEEDYVRPKEREKRLKRVARRRSAWAQRKWFMSRQGNPYINADGFNLTVFRKECGFGIVVSNRRTGASRLGRKTYSDELSAKLAALNALVWAKEHL
jgi:hypothetical protein